MEDSGCQTGAVRNEYIIPTSTDNEKKDLWHEFINPAQNICLARLLFGQINYPNLISFLMWEKIGQKYESKP